MIYGYCRISTPKQSIERQERNILKEFPTALIVKEIFTGTKIYGRKELEKIIRKIKKNDTIVFDSVSRMSRTATEGFLLYKDLFQKGINLIFLKEPHINTATYKNAIENQINITLESGDDAMDELMGSVVDALNRYILTLAERQIRLAFEQSEKEVTDLHQRTKEGIETARLNGKQIGRRKGATFETRKGKEAKKIILQHCKDFGGSLNDFDTRKLASISKNTYYKLKREIREKALGE